MRELAAVCERIGGTSKKSEKVALLAEYFKGRSEGEAAVSAVFLSGHAFPAHEETTLQVGGRMLWSILGELALGGEGALSEGYQRYGDLGAAAGEALLGTAPIESELGVLEVEAAFRAIAEARGAGPKKRLLEGLLAKATAVEAKYVVKIIGGDLRIGLKESLRHLRAAGATAARGGERMRERLAVNFIDGGK
jgi:DNA ligase-1